MLDQIVLPGGFDQLMFVFMHGPMLDKYLEERYGDGFRAYAKKTKKLIPFVY